MGHSMALAALPLLCLVGGAAAEAHSSNPAINITHSQIYDLSWHYASVEQLAATDQAIRDNARDMDIAWLVLCGQLPC